MMLSSIFRELRDGASMAAHLIDLMSMPSWAISQSGYSSRSLLHRLDHHASIDVVDLVLGR